MFSVNVGNSFSDKALIICGVPQGSILGPLLFLLHVNGKVQAVNYELLLCPYDTSFIFQRKGINIIENQLNRNFSNTCDWFKDKKLSIHFGEDKIKSILFAPLNKCKKLRKLNISYGLLKIKQYSEVIYLGCILGESLSGESIALHVVSKVNTRLKFLHRKTNFCHLNYGDYYILRLCSVISILYAQFGTTTSTTKNSKLSYKLFKTNVYVSAFN